MLCQGCALYRAQPVLHLAALPRLRALSGAAGALRVPKSLIHRWRSAGRLGRSGPRMHSVRREPLRVTGPALARRPSNRCSVAASTRRPRPGATVCSWVGRRVGKWWHLAAQLSRSALVLGRSRSLDALGPHHIPWDALDPLPTLGSNKLGRQEGMVVGGTWLLCRGALLSSAPVLGRSRSLDALGPHHRTLSVHGCTRSIHPLPSYQLATC